MPVDSNSRSTHVCKYLYVYVRVHERILVSLR